MPFTRLASFAEASLPQAQADPSRVQTCLNSGASTPCSRTMIPDKSNESPSIAAEKADALARIEENLAGYARHLGQDPIPSGQLSTFLTHGGPF